MATAEEGAPGIHIEVACAHADRQWLLPLTVPSGTTAEEAVQLSGILQHVPDFDWAVNRLGIFGRLCPPGRVLEAGDRVEIYRPLVADPKEVRRRLAAEGRTMGRERKTTGD